MLSRAALARGFPALSVRLVAPVAARRSAAVAVRHATTFAERQQKRDASSESSAMEVRTEAVTYQAPTEKEPTALEYGVQDGHLHKATPGDASQRTFTYLAMGSARFIYAAAVRVMVLKFVYSMSASADVLALSSVEYNLASLGPGDATTIKWRGKPVFIRNLKPEEIAELGAQDLGELRDPETHLARVQKDNWAIMLGVCTHLGCVPIHNAGSFGGFFCPCHGSHYDASGRIRKGPAPENMEIPPYQFVDDENIVIG